MKIKEYCTVELLESLVEGKDFISPDKEPIEKGSIGTVVEITENNGAIVEFIDSKNRTRIVGVALNILNPISEK